MVTREEMRRLTHWIRDGKSCVFLTLALGFMTAEAEKNPDATFWEVLQITVEQLGEPKRSH